MDKARFMYLQGMFYAGQGNKFGDYRDSTEAFTAFTEWMGKPWAEFLKMKVESSDFLEFNEGYAVVAAQRHALQLQRAAAQKELSDMLKRAE